MNQISLCMIVKNEESNLQTCLNQIKNFVSEIIIIDTGSIDETLKIAKEFTDKIYRYSWINDFSQARNFSLSKATKPWILVLDADELISKTDQEIIKTLVLQNQEDAFVFKHKNYTNDTGVSGWQPSQNNQESRGASGFWTADIIRLFRNNYQIQFQGKIHETVYNSIKQSNLRLLNTEISVHHYGELNKQRFQEKKQTYSELLKSRLNNKDFKEKTEDFICFELATELIKLNKITEAVSYLERAVQISEQENYLLQLGGLYILQKQLDKAENTLRKASSINSNNPSILINQAIIASEKQEFNYAIKKLEKALQLNPNSANAYFNLAIIYKKKNKSNKASQYFQKALELNPNYKSKIDSLI